MFCCTLFFSQGYMRKTPCAKLAEFISHKFWSPCMYNRCSFQSLVLLLVIVAGVFKQQLYILPALASEIFGRKCMLGLTLKDQIDYDQGG